MKRYSLQIYMFMILIFLVPILIYSTDIPIRRIIIEKPMEGIAIVGKENNKDYYELNGAVPPGKLLILPANENILIYLQDDRFSDDEDRREKFKAEDVNKLCQQSPYLAQAISIIRCQDNERLLKTLNYLQSQKQLMRMEIWQCNMNSDHLNAVANIHSLTTLSLVLGNYFDNESFGDILKRSNIRAIFLSGYDMRHYFFKEFSKMVNLNYISLNKIDLFNSDFEGIMKNSNVKKVELDRIEFSREKFSSNAMALKNLSAFSNLEDLSISVQRSAIGTDISDYSFLRSLKHLKKLSLNYTYIKEKDLSSIASLKELTDLDLSYQNSLNESDLKSLIEMKSLKKLRLHKTELGQEALANLSKLNYIVELD